MESFKRETAQPNINTTEKNRIPNNINVLGLSILPMEKKHERRRLQKVGGATNSDLVYEKAPMKISRKTYSRREKNCPLHR